MNVLRTAAVVALAATACGGGDAYPPDPLTQKLIEVTELPGFGGLHSEHGVLTVAFLGPEPRGAGERALAEIFADSQLPLITVRPTIGAASPTTVDDFATKVAAPVSFGFDPSTGYVRVRVNREDGLEPLETQLRNANFDLDLVILGVEPHVRLAGATAQ